MTVVKTYLRDDITTSITRVRKSLQNVVCATNIQSRAASIEAFNQHRIITKLQTFFGLKFDARLDSIVYETILTYAIKAEQLGPGAFDLFVDAIINDRIPDCPTTSFRAKADDVQWLLQRFVEVLDQTMYDMIAIALDLAGFGGKIIVERAHASIPSVELINGYVFNVKPLIEVSDMYLKHCSVACIDGFVENVSEIHGLLESASEKKQPIVLFVRGASDEVLHTLRVNHIRNSLCVIPFLVPFDTEGVNILTDIAVVAGGDLVSSLKGDLISTVSLSSLPIVPEIVVGKTCCTLRCSTTSKSVLNHISYLQQKRLEVDEFIGKLLDKRIRSLTSSYVLIRLIDDNNYTINAQSLDYVLRSYASLISHGTVTLKNGERVLFDAAHTANTQAYACLQQLSRLGAVIDEL